MKTLGWNIFIEPALQTEKGGVSSGVAICVRLHVDCWQPESAEPFAKGRVACAFARCGKLGTVALYTAYFKVGIGLGQQNCDLAAAILGHAAAHGKPLVVGADWNLDPLSVRSFPWHSIGAQVVEPFAPTCRTTSGASVRDFFVVSRCLLQAEPAVFVIGEADLPTHSPVALRFRRGVQRQLFNTLARPKNLPVERYI